MENSESLKYKYIFFTISLLIFILIFFYTIDIFLLTFAAILLAIFLRSLNSLIQKIYPIPDSISMSIVILTLLILSFLIVFLISPVVIVQMQELINNASESFNKIKEKISSFVFVDKNDWNYESLLPSHKNIIIRFATLFSTTFGIIGSFLIFLSLGLFLAFDPATYKKGFINLFPFQEKKQVTIIMNSVTETLNMWLRGKLFSMFIVGFLTSLGLWFLNLPLVLTLGLLAAILTFIPNIGPIISAVPTILIAFNIHPMSAVYVVVLYTAVQILESYIITPIIQSKTISQPPALIIFVQLIMALLTGALGLALATPLLIVLSAIIQELRASADVLE